MSADTNNSRGLALGDVNGDGNLDAVFANENQANRVCLGDGDGTFDDVPCANISADTNFSFGVSLGDVNGDGDLDALFANNDGISGEVNRVCLGDGDGTFDDVPCANISADTNDSFGLALGDVNGDGDLDAVFANNGVANRVCLGDGDGTFDGGGCSDISADANVSVGVALGELGSPSCGGLAATHEGSAQGDDLRGGPGNDVMFGWGGKDTLTGGLGVDTLCGGRGPDTLLGGGGRDFLFGGPGTDTLRGAGSSDWLYGGAGTDFLQGGPGPIDRLFGGNGNDTLQGNGGNDRISGGAGNGGPGIDQCFAEIIVLCEI